MLLRKIIKTALDKFYFPFLWKGAAKKFARLRQTAQTPEDAFALACSFHHGLPIRGLNINIKPAQIPEEIIALVKKIQQEKPQVILEIGTATGGTLFLWSQFFPEATFISIDLPFGQYGAGYLPTKARFLKSFARDKQTVELISADSHAPETKQRLEDFLGGRKIDFAFIDGDHSYEGVKKDFWDYKDLVKHDGIIAFHDIAGEPGYGAIGVPRFWEEIKKDYPDNEEYKFGGEGQYWAGIGVLRLNR